MTDFVIDVEAHQHALLSCKSQTDFKQTPGAKNCKTTWEIFIYINNETLFDCTSVELKGNIHFPVLAITSNLYDRFSATFRAN